MFCPKCGTQMNDAGVCPNCTKNSTPKKTISSAKIAKILSLVCIAAFLLGTLIALNTSVIKLPIIKFAADLSGESMDDMEEIFDNDDVIDEIEDELKEIEDELDKKDYKLVKKYINTGLKLIKNPSISNASATCKALENVVDADVEVSSADFEDELKDLKEAVEILDIITIVLWVFSIVLSLLILLAGMKRIGGVAILVLILNLIPALALVGVLYFLITTALIIAEIVFIKKAKKEAKAA